MNKTLENLTAELVQIVNEAEKAVSNIEDKELKQIAFDRILQHLLQIGLPKSEDKNKKGTSKPASIKTDNNSSTKPGPKNWIQELVDEGFFQTPKANNAIRVALDERGHILKATDLTGPLDRLVNEKVLRRKKMPAEEGGKPQVHWYNW